MGDSTEALLEELRGFAPLAGEGLRYLLLDVFTATPLAGNQVAVFTDARGIDAGLMQAIALELRLSESVFLLPARAGGDVRARIFTPAAELPFAGHPVLGTAVALGCALARERVSLETDAGVIQLRLELEGPRRASGWMEQPLPTVAPFEQARELLAALALERSTLPVELYDNGVAHVFVALHDADAVAALRPDLAALEDLGPYGFNCFAGAGSHFVTRMFAPALGVAEDPATGSAAGPLAVHACRHGRAAFGSTLEIEQGARVGRPSLLLARARGGHDRLDAVEVGGTAVIVGEGALAP